MGLRGLVVVKGGLVSLSFMFMSVIGGLDGLGLLSWRAVGLGLEEEEMLLLLLSGEGRMSLVLLGRESGSLWIIILVGNS